MFIVLLLFLENSIPCYANPVVTELSKLISFFKSGRNRIAFTTARGQIYQKFLLRRIELELKSMDGWIATRRRRLLNQGKVEEAKNLTLAFGEHTTLSSLLTQDLTIITDSTTYTKISSRIASLPETRFLIHRLEELDKLVRKEIPSFTESVPENFTWNHFNKSDPAAAQEIQRLIESRFINPTKVEELTEMLNTIAARQITMNNPFVGGVFNPMNWAPPLRTLPRQTYQVHLQNEYHRRMIDFMIRKDGIPIAELFQHPKIPIALKKLAHKQITQNVGHTEVSTETRINMRTALEQDPYVTKDVRQQINKRINLEDGQSVKVPVRGDKINPVTRKLEPLTNKDWVISDEALMSTYNIMYRGHRVKNRLAGKPITGNAISLYDKAASRIPGVKTIGKGVERVASTFLTGGASYFLKYPPGLRLVPGSNRWVLPLPNFLNFARQYRSAMFAAPKLSWKTTEFHFEWVLEQLSGLTMLTIANLENTDIVPITERWGQVAVDVVCIFLVDSALVFFLSPRYQYWHPNGYLVTKPIQYRSKLLDRTIGKIRRGSKNYLKSLPNAPLQGMSIAEAATLQHIIPTARIGAAGLQRLQRIGLRRRVNASGEELAAAQARRMTNESVDLAADGGSALWRFYNSKMKVGGYRLDQRISTYALKAGLFAGVGFSSGILANSVTKWMFDKIYDLSILFDTDAAFETDKEFPDNLRVGKAWANLMAGVTHGSPLPWASTSEGARYQLGDLPFLMTSTSRYAFAGLINNRIAKFFKTATGKGIRANPKTKALAFTTLLLPIVRAAGKSKILNRAGRIIAPIAEASARYGVRFGNNYWGNKIWIMHASNFGIIPKKGNPGVLKSVIEYDLHSSDFMIDLREPEDSIIEAWEKGRGK